MTWFETEQIYHYLSHLESRLDEWALSRLQMQAEKAELSRLDRQLHREINGTLPLTKKDLLLELFGRIRQCESCIEERLKY